MPTEKVVFEQREEVREKVLWVTGRRLYRANSKFRLLELGAFLGCQQGDRCEWGQVRKEQISRTERKEVMGWALGLSGKGWLYKKP